MNDLATRKCAGLEQKLAALDAEFKEWLQITEDSGEFEKHHTQLRALTGHLGGIRSKTDQLFAKAKASGILGEARNLESLVLGIRRIWEFFRSKLVQRRDPEMRCFLQLADELAWACYRPVLDIAGPKARREPPLVFLNGGLSPFAVSRDEAFTAEDVPGEALAGGTWDKVLHRLPIPVIGVPWYQTAHIPDLPVVSHEAGHTVEQDFGLHDDVLKNIAARLKGTEGEARSDHWKAWSNEIFADLWGCIALGPAFVQSLMDFLAISPAIVDNEIATDQGKYPTAQLRILLCLEALDKLQFTGEVSGLRIAWGEEFKGNAMPGFEQDVKPVVAAILDCDYDIGGKKWYLPAIPKLAFTPEDWSFAKQGADERRRGKSVDSANTAPRLVAAARFSFDEDSNRYATGKYGEAFKQHIQTLIHPGTRAGESKIGAAEKERLSETSRAAGEAWFDDFATWAGGANL